MRRFPKDHYHPRERGRTFVDDLWDALYFWWRDKARPTDRVFVVLMVVLSIVAVVVWVWALR